MKLDRLIAILSVLLNREQTTAPELAKRFEVSRRTINRDIDALNQAGIPVVAQQGAGGGIRIMDGFRSPDVCRYASDPCRAQKPGQR